MNNCITTRYVVFAVLFCLFLMRGWPESVAQESDRKSSGLTQAATQDEKPSRYKTLGKIENKTLVECSGIAISRTFPGHVWMHNDSGSEAIIYLISKIGKTKSEVELRGVKARDFEDIASFDFRKQNYIAIADVGDNLRRLKQTEIYVFKEPPPEELRQKTVVDPLLCLTVRYEDKIARDCEAIAFHSPSGQFLLCSKPRTSEILQGSSAELFSVAFDWTRKNQDCVARRMGKVAGGLITAMDCSSDGKKIIVRNYVYANLWTVGSNEFLKNLTAAGATRIPMPLQRQAEAICFSREGRSLLTTSEGKNQLLFEISID